MEKKTFGDRLKELRAAKNMTQKELAKAANITTRSVQNYEIGVRTPANITVVQQLAGALGVLTNDLLGEDERLVVEASEKGGYKAKRDVKELASEVTGLFAGGDIDDAEKDAVMAALSNAYWNAKKKNEKYTPKKYRKSK
jgi:transcriptional regulator with XRE-family HTH domain